MLKPAGGQISAQIPMITSTSFIAMSTTVTSSTRTAILGLEQRARRCCGAVGKYASMAVAPTGEIHVAYYDQTQNIPLRKTKSRWQMEKVQYRLGSRSGNGKRNGSGPKGTPHIFYYSPAGFLVTRLPMQRTLPNGINMSCTKHSADSLHASHPSSMVRPFGFPTSIGTSAKLHST